jgi:hypothetical protein
MRNQNLLACAALLGYLFGCSSSAGNSIPPDASDARPHTDAGSGSDGDKPMADSGKAESGMVDVIDSGACATGPSVGDLYVSVTGNDGWSGTLPAPNASHTDGPLATLGAAESKVAALLKADPTRSTPILVLIRGGTYALSEPLSFGPSTSGTATARVTYAAYRAETPTLSGGVAITGWTKTGAYFTASAAGLQPFEQLFVNGTRHYRPFSATGYLYNEGPVYVSASQTNCTTSTSSGYECLDRFRFRAGDLDSSWHDLTDVEIDDFEDWTMARMRLKSVDTTNNIAYLTGATYGAPYHGFLSGHRYLAENVREQLAQPGQWYFDRAASSILYVAAPGEDPNSEALIAPQATQLIQASGLSHVTFQGLTFSNVNWTVPAAGHPSGQGEQNVGAALSFTDSSDIVIDHCTLSHVGPWGIEFIGLAPGYLTTASEPYAFQVENSVLTDIGAGGIRIGVAPGSGTAATVAQHALIQNNRIQGGGRLLPQGTAVWIGDSHDNRVSHNQISDFYNVGVSVGFTFNYAGDPGNASGGLATGNVVEFNTIYDLGQGVTSDMGGIYTLVSNPKGGSTALNNNVIHDVIHDPGTGGYGGWGLYFDQGSTNVTAENNLVYNTSAASVHENWGVDDTLDNNVFAFGAIAELDRGKQDPPDSLAMTVTHNIFYWDMGGLQYGTWSCNDDHGVATQCTQYFSFDSNLYFDTRGKTYLFSTSSPSGSYNLAGWQALMEDLSGEVGDPLFKSASTRDFTLSAASPAIGLGFHAFDPSEAGPSAACLPPSPPAVPPGFPPQLHGAF